MLKRLSCLSLIIAFVFSLVGPYKPASAEGGSAFGGQLGVLGLPQPGAMVNLSPIYEPALIKGLTVHKDNPFLFDFIVDTGHSGLSGNALKQEGDRLVRYFFACLTIPEKDIWVNLSPYEKDRMVPEALGQTGLGRDLLAQDYLLKQLTASLIYPEKDLGKEFWDRVYARAQQEFGTTQIPVNTFNKVWILADKATVYEHGQTAFVVDGHLKVMLDEDYQSLKKHEVPGKAHTLASNIIRQIILPEIEKEVNTGKNFAMLRQIFYAQILATWYKKNLKAALLNQVYADKSTVKGINLSDPSIKEKIYRQYLEAYKKGVFNYIKEDNQSTPRKYFSGGYDPHISQAMVVLEDNAPGITKILRTFSGRIVKLFTLSTMASSSSTSNTPYQVLADNSSQAMLSQWINSLTDPQQEELKKIIRENHKELSGERVIRDALKQFRRYMDNGEEDQANRLKEALIYHIKKNLGIASNPALLDLKNLDVMSHIADLAYDDTRATRGVQVSVEYSFNEWAFTVRVTEKIVGGRVGRSVAKNMGNGRKNAQKVFEAVCKNLGVNFDKTLKTVDMYSLIVANHETIGRKIKWDKNRAMTAYDYTEEQFTQIGMDPMSLIIELLKAGVIRTPDGKITDEMNNDRIGYLNRLISDNDLTSWLGDGLYPGIRLVPAGVFRNRLILGAFFPAYSPNFVVTINQRGKPVTGYISDVIFVLHTLANIWGSGQQKVLEFEDLREGMSVWKKTRLLLLPDMDKTFPLEEEVRDPKTHELIGMRPVFTKEQQQFYLTIINNIGEALVIHYKDITFEDKELVFIGGPKPGIRPKGEFAGYAWNIVAGKISRLLISWEKAVVENPTAAVLPPVKKLLKLPEQKKVETPSVKISVTSTENSAMNSVTEKVMAHTNSWENGGIDLNTSNGMQWSVVRDGQGVVMDINPAMLAQIKEQGIDRLSPIIFKVTPLASIWPLTGFQAEF